VSQTDKRRHLQLSAQAAEWLVRLDADDPQERARAQEEYAGWQQASPENLEVARRLEALLAPLVRMRQGQISHPARTALDAALKDKPQRRASLGVLLGLFVLLLIPLAVAWPEWSAGYLLADLKTDTGQWQTESLADGSRLTLSSHSAVNIHYYAQRREVELVAGRIWVDVAPDPARPFVVTTPQGRIQALGTRFTVDREEGATVLTMLESRVRVHPEGSGLNNQGEGLVVRAGQRLRFTGNGPEAMQEVDVESADHAWRNHQLVVQDMPLDQVLATLNRNRRGNIDYSAPEMGRLRVTAVLPLDDTDKALQLLQLLFPALQVKYYTGYWVRVRLQDSSAPL